MTELLLALLGLAAGIALGWMLAQRGAARERERGIEIQRQTAVELKQELENSFQAIASRALQSNSEQLITVAGQKFAPFDEQLKQLKKATEELENRRQHAYGSLSKELESLKTSTTELRSQSEKLSTALRGSSQARGNWGESTLRRLAELAGMEEHCDFDLQQTTASGQRPDLVVQLPGKGAIPVDAKVPLAAYLDAEAASDEDVRRARLAQHAADL